MGVKHPSDYGATLSAFGFPEFTSSFLRSLFPTFHAESVNVVEVVSTALEKIYRKSWIRLQPLGRVVGHLDIFFLTPFCIGCRRNHGNMGLAKLVPRHMELSAKRKVLLRRVYANSPSSELDSRDNRRVVLYRVSTLYVVHTTQSVLTRV